MIGRKLLLAAALLLLAPPAVAQLDRVEAYKPMYFAMGQTDGESVSRYRLSVAVPISNEPLRLPMLPDGEPVFTMTITGTADNDSSFYFQRENFRPQAFYRWALNWRYLDWLKLGGEHYSSGERGPLSSGYHAGLFEGRSTVLEYDSLTVRVYVAARVFVPWGFEENTDALRDLVTVWGRDFFPTAAIAIDWRDARVYAEGHRDGYDIELTARAATLVGVVGGAVDATRVPFVGDGINWLAAELRDRWNFHAFGRWHSGTLEDIATYSHDVDAWQVGAAVVPGW